MFERNASVISRFLVHGARVNVTDTYGSTPLMFAVKYKIIEIVDILVRAGSSVDAIDQNVSISLMYAACSKNIDKMVF